MDFLKRNWFGIAVLIVVVYFVATFNPTIENKIMETVGVAPQTSNFDAVVVKEFTQGGGLLSLTDAASITLTEDQMLNNNVFVLAASTTAGTYTLTLPATSTMDELIPNTGDTKMWFFKNENTTAATTTTVAAGTGIVLDEPDGQNVVIGGGNRAKLECFRDDDTNVVCSVDEHIDAD